MAPKPNYANWRAIPDSAGKDAAALGERLGERSPHSDLEPENSEAIEQYKMGSAALNRRLVREHTLATTGESGDDARSFERLDDNTDPSSTHSAVYHTYRDMHNELKRAMRIHATATPEAFSTFSGVAARLGDQIKSTKVGDTFHSPAWISSSLDPRRAHNFADPSNATKHVVEFKIPEGFKNGAYIGHLHGFAHEREFLINAGTTWKKTRTTKHVEPGIYDPTYQQTTYLHTLEPHDN